MIVEQFSRQVGDAVVRVWTVRPNIPAAHKWLVIILALLLLASACLYATALLIEQWRHVAAVLA